MSEGLTQRRVNGKGSGKDDSAQHGLSDAPRSASAASPSITPSSSSSSSSASSSTSLFSSNPSKRRGEIFFLAWGGVWIPAMGVIVATRIFESFTASSYMIVGLSFSIPPFILPLLFPGSDASIPWHKRYTTKANAWIFILSWVANYFWTHYFYNVLGASYTFHAWRLNDVPFALYLMTHSYFHFYHVLSNIALRWCWSKVGNKPRLVSTLIIALIIAVMSYVVAFMETWTIQNFPYYHIPDRHAMYVYGSMFYALYFLVSFPMFLRLDEKVGECWSLSRSVVDALAASMLITQCLDAWRLGIGPIVDLDAARRSAMEATPNHLRAVVQPPNREKSVPFVY